MLWGLKLESSSSQMGPCLHIWGNLLVLFIFAAVSTMLDVGGFSQSLRSIEADDLNHTVRTVRDSRTTSAGTGNSRQGVIVTTLCAIAAQRRRGRASVAVHRACHAGTNELPHGGNGRRHRRRDSA